MQRRITLPIWNYFFVYFFYDDYGSKKIRYFFQKRHQSVCGFWKRAVLFSAKQIITETKQYLASESCIRFRRVLYKSDAVSIE